MTARRWSELRMLVRTEMVGRYRIERATTQRRSLGNARAVDPIFSPLHLQRCCFRPSQNLSLRSRLFDLIDGCCLCRILCSLYHYRKPRSIDRIEQAVRVRSPRMNRYSNLSCPKPSWECCREEQNSRLGEFLNRSSRCPQKPAGAYPVLTQAKSTEAQNSKCA